MKRFIWNVLSWIDDNINHTVVDWFFDLFPCENKDGSDSIPFLIWSKTFYAFCSWVNITLSEKWFPEEWV